MNKWSYLLGIGSYCYICYGHMYWKHRGTHVRKEWWAPVITEKGWGLQLRQGTPYEPCACSSLDTQELKASNTVLREGSWKACTLWISCPWQNNSHGLGGGKKLKLHVCIRWDQGFEEEDQSWLLSGERRLLAFILSWTGKCVKNFICI